jgi:P27 family predicted phage terminase small subunit
MGFAGYRGIFVTTPKQLKKIGKAKWRQLADQFDLSSPLSVDLLVQYCEAFELHCRAKEELDEDTLVRTAPNGAPYPHPSVNICIKTSDQMRRLYKQLEAIRKTNDKSNDLDLDKD